MGATATATEAVRDELCAPSRSLFYGKTLLGPMVRVCSLGFRVLCADNGADVVFTEEVVAAKLRHCRREVRRYPSATSPESGEDIAEYVVYEPFKKSFKRSVVLALHTRGSSRGDPPSGSGAPVVLQLGACDGRIAADAAALCCDDVSGIDVNMGCPKKFSVSNGFGAALMDNTATAGSILQSIHERVNTEEAVAARGGRSIAISFKTRLKDRENAERTVDMLRDIARAAGHSATTPVIHAVTLHARVREQRSEEPPLLGVAAEVVRRCRAGRDGVSGVLSNVCFVLNGSVENRLDGAAKGAQFGFDGCMIARAAMWDPVTVFSRLPVTRSTTVAERDEAHYMASLKALMLHSVRYRSKFKDFKYHLSRVFPEVPCIKHRMPFVQERLRGYEDCYDFFGLSEEERANCRLWAQDVEVTDSIPGVPVVKEKADERTTTKRPRSEEGGGNASTRCVREGTSLQRTQAEAEVG